jgi:lipopolysaccharide export system permease protein
MKIFDFYIFKNVGIATIFVTLCLSAIIFLTQSLRFLELVIEAGASSTSFWILTLLALPRFFEVLVPIAFMGAVLFVYNRMSIDSELVVIRATGKSPLSLAKPVLILSIFMTLFLVFMTMWAAPKSLSTMQEMRQLIKSQFSTALFREGVFNNFGKGLTLYIKERAPNGELHGIIIHDTRAPKMPATTILAERGILRLTDEGYQVVVNDGARQAYKKDSNGQTTDIFQNLKFKSYSIDLPDSEQARIRWAEPDERTVFELLSPDLENTRDMESLRDFKVDFHRRIITPFLAPVFAMIALSCLLLGQAGRRGQSNKIMLAISLSVLVQGFYIASFNIARNSNLGLVIMYSVIAWPFFVCTVLLSPIGFRLTKALRSRSTSAQSIAGNTKGERA